jgi:hypothetical protein
VIYVVDRSESIPAEKREAAREFVVGTAVERDAVKGDLVGVVAFGKDAGIEWVPKEEELDLESFATVIEADGTDIAGALRLATAAFPGGAGKRIVLLSDGNENRGDAVEEARNARSQGVSIDVVPITYAYPAEISIEKVLIDPQMQRGTPFDVRVVVNSSREARAALRLFENDRMVGQRDPTVDLKPGKNVFDFRGLRIDAAGLYFYEARIEAARIEDDNLLQNNTAFGFTVVKRPWSAACAPRRRPWT